MKIGLPLLGQHQIPIKFRVRVTLLSCPLFTKIVAKKSDRCNYELDPVVWEATHGFCAINEDDNILTETADGRVVWQCPHEAYETVDGEARCQFHLPTNASAKPDSATIADEFVEIVNGHKQALEGDRPRPAQFIGATFESLTLSEDQIGNGCEIDLRHAEIEVADWSETTINVEKLDSRGACIEREWNCMSAVFSGPAVFSWAEFGGDARFDEAELGGPGGFVETEFGGEAEFGETEFDKGAGFSRAEFGGEATFRGAEFSEHAGFGGAEFGGKAMFNEAKFDRHVNFRKTDFSSLANFALAKFDGRVIFSRAEFGRSAGFFAAKFDKRVYFKWAKFAQDASFDSVKFGKGASFDGAEFSGTAWFSRAEFRGEAVFDQQTIGDRV